MSRKKKIMVPGAQNKLEQLRFEIAKKLNYISGDEDNWWESMTKAQQSEVNGQVTKMMVMKAQIDMVNGNFKH